MNVELSDDKALHESEKRIRELMELAPDGIFIADLSGMYTYVNSAGARLLGYHKADIIGKTIMDLIPESDVPRLWRDQKQLLNHKVVVGEWVLRHRDGHYIPVEVSAKILPDGRWQGFVRDISERKQHEMLLRESEKRYKDLMQEASNGIMLFDLSAKIIDCNRSVLRMLGYTKKELIGKRIDYLADSEELAETPPRIKEMLEHKTLVTERTMIRKDGSKITAELSNKLIGENTIQTIVRDITEIKQIEERKDAFIAIAAHELKTPVTAIQTLTEIVGKHLSADGNAKDAELARHILEQVNRLTRLINGLLDTSKIQAGQTILDNKTFDINDVIRKVVLNFRYSTKTHKLIVKGRAARQLYGDEQRIEQVLTNLVLNAIKFSPDSDKVIIKIENTKDAVIVRVQDFGLGISAAEQENIFGRFARSADRKKYRKEGLGLGLYISSEIVKKHKGKLWVDSTEGKGSTFNMRLMMVDA